MFSESWRWTVSHGMLGVYTTYISLRFVTQSYGRPTSATPHKYRGRLSRFSHQLLMMMVTDAKSEEMAVFGSWLVYLDDASITADAAMKPEYDKVHVDGLMLSAEELHA